MSNLDTHPLTLKLSRISLHVHDLPAEVAFYRDVLGLHAVEDPSDPHRVDLDGAGCILELHDGGFTRDWEDAPRLVFHADDVAAVREQLIEQGAKLGKLKSYGNLQSVDGHDPEGNLFQITNRS
jgi:catechol 2,3-dioxygenase-like lactoylglutathione lyase family enzyme